MTEPVNLGDWVCYDSDNKLQPHNASHKKPKKQKPIKLRSKLKRFFTSLFHKSQKPPTNSIENDDDEWTCHDRTLMRYTPPRLGIQTIIAGGMGYADDSATPPAENHKQHKPRSTTLVVGSPTDRPFFHSARTHEYTLPYRDSIDVTPTPTMRDRTTLRMVTPTTDLYAQCTQKNRS